MIFTDLEAMATSYKRIYRGSILEVYTPHALRGWLFQNPILRIWVYRADRVGD